MLLVKVIVLVLLGFVIVSLFSGLYFLVKDKGQSNRTVNALSIRIGLSLVAILVILIAAATGAIEFNASPLSPGNPAQHSPTNTDSEPEQSTPGSGRRPINSGY